MFRRVVADEVRFRARKACAGELTVFDPVVVAMAEEFFRGVAEALTGMMTSAFLGQITVRSKYVAVYFTGISFSFRMVPADCQSTEEGGT
jgi:hypothetical protein